MVSLALAIYSLSSLLMPSSVKAGAFASNICNTGKYLIFTKPYPNGEIVYTAFQGYYDSNDQPNRKPDLVLYNGSRIFINNKTQELRTWRTSGGYTYQVLSPSPQGSDDPRSFLTVKRRGRVIIRQQCQ